MRTLGVRVSGRFKEVIAPVRLMADKARKLTIGEIARLKALKK